MKKFVKIFFFTSFFALFSILSSGCSNNQNQQEIGNNKDTRNTLDFSKTSITKKISPNETQNLDEKNNSLVQPADVNEETVLANFSTPLTSGSVNRITNIKLTCEKINGRTLKDGETFSFNQIVGPCTAEEGYKKAEIYVNKKIQYALGGGNCQVSTTLYNSVLAVPMINVTERHEHNGRNVDYIEDGKDATVSYNTLDLKFVNNTGSEIKLYTWCDDVNVYAKITKI